jgi:hypothetical protein
MAVPLALAALVAAPASASASGRISGTVTSTSGHPIDDVSVTLHGMFAEWWDVTTATTNADGDYAFESVPAGHYDISFRSRGGGVTEHSSVSLEGGEDLDVDASLAVGGMITGRVTNTGGDPIEGVCVSAAGPGGTRSGADGFYQVLRVPPGPTYVQFTPCGESNFFGTFTEEFTIGEDEVRTGVDVTLRRAGGISGRVTDANGAPLAMLCVQASTKLDLSSPIPFSHADDYTDADGSYRLKGLRADSYDFSVRQCGTNSPSYLAENRRVELADEQELSGFDVVLRAGGHIGGRVVDYSGAAMKDVCVHWISSWVYGLDGKERRSALRAARAHPWSTDSEGRYLTPALPDGSYVIEFFTCPWLSDPSLYGSPIISQFYRGQSEPEHATPIQIVNAQSRLDVNARLVDSPNACVVPRLTGRKLSRAEARIDDTTCRVGKVRRAVSARRTGRVIAQAPAEGSVRPKKARVKLVVSAG